MAAPSGTGGILADVTDGGDETDMLCASNRLIRGGSLITLHGQEGRAELGVLYPQDQGGMREGRLQCHCGE